MENLKTRVENEAESKEAQDLFLELGFKKGVVGRGCYPMDIVAVICPRFSRDPYSSSATRLDHDDHKDYKKLSIQELRDMVVLKRNDPKDANVYQDGDIPCLYDLYLTGSKELYFYHCGKKAWILSNLNHDKDYYELLKPIKEGAMKEYLFKYNDQYTLVELSKEDAESNPEQYIKVPEGAEKLTSDESKTLTFWKSECESMNVGEGNFWVSSKSDDVLTFSEYSEYPYTTLWQREKESINDKMATAEVARQEEKHSHYKKDVSHLNVIDPYRIADLYNLHPCADHIMKKSLCAGNRGHKDTLRDIQDIIDTAERWKQMLEEDSNEI